MSICFSSKSVSEAKIRLRIFTWSTPQKFFDELNQEFHFQTDVCAYESALDGATVVCLVPARTDTAWWHNYAMLGEIRFVRERLKFGKSENAAPFPSVVVIFRL